MGLPKSQLIIICIDKCALSTLCTYHRPLLLPLGMFQPAGKNLSLCINGQPVYTGRLVRRSHAIQSMGWFYQQTGSPTKQKTISVNQPNRTGTR